MRRIKPSKKCRGDSTVSRSSEKQRGKPQNDALRPNILFIIADDLNYRTIHALNNPEIHTPNLDRLVAQGTTFTHCFHQGSWSSAVCIASRTMLYTGYTTFKARQYAETAPLWVETLTKAGYDTHIVGKWHLSRHNLKRSFATTGPIGPPGMFVSTTSSREAYNRPAPGNTWQPWDKSRKGHWVPAPDWMTKNTSGKADPVVHSNDIWTNAAVDFLAGRGGQTAPFMLCIGSYLPHDPRQAPKHFFDLYPPAKISVPPNYLPCHPFDLGDYTVRDERLAPFPRTQQAVQQHRSEYYAVITKLDADIGRVLSALDQSGQAENTIVIVTSDHGLAVGEHGLMGKQNLYDCSVRMPLIIRGPGIAQGKILDAMVYQHSIYPTVCELAAVDVPPCVEFPSLAGMLRGENTVKHDVMFCRYRDLQRSVRTRRYKLIVYPQINLIQLFDLLNDPWETANLAQSPEYAQVKRKLMAKLGRLQKQLGDPLSPLSVADEPDEVKEN